jgi:hypothetical protein
MAQPDSLKALVEVLHKVPYSYWAEKEPWKIIIMCWTVLNLHALEPAILILCLKFPGMANWFRRLAEDSDDKPNLVDAIRVIMILLVLWAGRGFVICGVWWCIFQENQGALMGVLAGFIAALLGSAIFTGNKHLTNVEDKSKHRRQAKEPAR